MGSEQRAKIESNSERDNVANILNTTDPATHIIGGIVCILDLMFCFSIIDGTPAYGYTTNSRRKGVCANNKVNTASCICLCVYVWYGHYVTHVNG
jgi:hypothetical protein